MFVGNGDQGLVIADSAMQSDDPLLQSGASQRFAFQRNLQRGARPLSEQAAQVTVAALGDHTEPLLTAGTVL